MESNIGINCTSKNCLLIHPSELFMIYSVGSLIVIKSIDGSKDQYLSGHQAMIHCLAISSQGNLLASGEQHEANALDTLAALIVWDFNSREILYRVRFHK